jgi:DNA-binding transcriptional regulator WhiA
VTHFNNCKAKKGQGKANCSKELAAIKQQTALCKMASDKLQRMCKIASDKPELEISNITNTLDKKVSFQEISSSYYKGVNRKQAQEEADSDPENLH